MENVYELLYMIRMQDEFALRALLDHFSLIKMIILNKVIKNYPYLKFEKEDLLQEMALVIVQAAEAYREDQQCGFDTYVTRCIKNRFLVMVKSALADKRKININCVSMDIERVYGSTGLPMNPFEFAVDKDTYYDPVYCYHYKESFFRLKRYLGDFSDQDRMILGIYIKDQVEDYLQDKSLEERRIFLNRLALLKRKCRKLLSINRIN